MGFAEKLKTNATAFRIADLLTIAVILLLGLGAIEFVSVSSAPLSQELPLSSDISEIPKYALLSLTRGLIALAMSFVFAITYATVAAKSKTSERILMPILDVLQSLPVLVFLAPAVLTLIALFRDTRWGLEFACIFLIFTGQVWNLTYAYYEAQKNASKELSEVARLVKMTPMQVFFYVDLPAGVRPLVYNGMLSMAGGWFFLATCEAFTLGEKSFLLPGLGSYLSYAFQTENYSGFVLGIFAMFSMILACDFIIWRPLIAWSSRFRDTGGVDEDSFFLDVFRKTHIPQFFSHNVRRFFSKMRNSNNPIAQRSSYENLLKAGIEIQTLLHLKRPNKTHGNTLLKTVTRLPWMRWASSVGIAVFLLYILPLAPRIGDAMSVLSSEDWFSLTNALGLSALKVFGALLLGSLWTVPMGLWIGKNVKVANVAVPISQNIAAFPAPIFFPLIVMFVAKAHVPDGVIATLLMAIGTQWYILFNVISGAKIIPEDLKTVVRVCKLSLWKRWRYLYFPVLLPSINTGWRTAVGGAWNITIVAEMVKYPGGELMSDGIGAEITKATEMGDYPRLVAAIIVLVVGVIFLNRTVWRPLHAYIDNMKT